MRPSAFAVVPKRGTPLFNWLTMLNVFCQANLGPEETKLYIEFLTAVRGSPVTEAEIRSMNAAAIKHVDQVCLHCPDLLPRPNTSTTSTLIVIPP